MSDKRSGKQGERLANLPVCRIRTDAGTQSRARIDEAVAADYAEAMVNGSRFPPIVVFHHDGEFILSDGFHRLRAARLAKFDKIKAEVREGTRLDAVKFSLASNHRHGLRRTNQDKQFAVALALREFSSWSDRAIAELVIVSPPLVSSVRRELKILTVEGSRLGRDGKRRRLPVRNNGHEPHSLPDPPANNSERASQAEVCDIAERLSELETTIRSFMTRFPDRKTVILGLIRKVKSDLTFLEMKINPKRG